MGLGALRYAMLSVDNVKQITFDWESALSFDGQAAPYIQYAHVRAASILARAPAPPAQPERTCRNGSEMDLIDAVARFPGEVQHSAQDYKPLHMANYAYALAKAFTDFYQQCPVLQARNRHTPRACAWSRPPGQTRPIRSLLAIAAPDIM